MADLYIRSIDGCTLTKAKTLNIESCESCYVIYGDLDYSLPLGAYKTEERAKEVLDEIQKLLTRPTAFLKANMPQGSSYKDANNYSEQIFDFCKQYDFIYIGSKDIEVIPTNNTNIVYQMPEE